MSSSISTSRPRLSWALRIARRILFPEWLFNRRVRTTRSGYIYLFMIVAVSGAAFNTGNNMLYLVLAMMIGALFSSFMLSEYMIAELIVTRKLPAYVTEGVPFRIRYQVKNEKQVIPSASVRITETLPGSEIAALIVFLGGAKQAEFKGTGIAAYRGRIKMQGMALSTTAPFGLFHKTKKVPLYGEFIALPRADSREIDKDVIASLGEQRPVYKPGRGDQLFGFRKYVRGDPVKDIHWKTSARVAELMVREPEAEEERKLRIVLDVPGPRPEDRDPARESAVRKAASLAESAINDGWQVRIERHGKGLDFGYGPRHLHEVLVFLAMFDDPESPSGRPLAPSDSPGVEIS